MSPATSERAVSATLRLANDLGLDAVEAVVLQDSNRVTVRLLPCDVVARIARRDAADRRVADFEVSIARACDRPGSVIGRLHGADVVHEADDFLVTLWTYHEPVGIEIAPDDYATALLRLHVEFAQCSAPAPHFTERVAEALAIVDDREQSPDLGSDDRAFLTRSLRRLEAQVTRRMVSEQLLHGEPHPGNLVQAADGIRFIDLQTCCVGPVEFDLAHAPVEVAAHYEPIDTDLLRDCRSLMLAMVAAWRTDRDDQLPNGASMLADHLVQLRRLDAP